jgi:hypothetical protein
MLMFHGNRAGSAGNITPTRQDRLSDAERGLGISSRTPTRPEYIAHRDFTPIQTVDDDALLRLARAHRQRRSRSRAPNQVVVSARPCAGIHVLAAQRMWVAGQARP